MRQQRVLVWIADKTLQDFTRDALRRDDTLYVEVASNGNADLLTRVKSERPAAVVLDADGAGYQGAVDLIGSLDATIGLVGVGTDPPFVLAQRQWRQSDVRASDVVAAVRHVTEGIEKTRWSR